jgi:WNK lysine deficient protein kinase
VPVAWCELHDRKFSKLERQRFVEEAEMLKQLQHPNIVRFYDYWEDTKVKPKKIILVTELMTSGTLKAYVQRFKKQDKNKRLKVIKNFANQILKGLAYLHSRNVIHRDLKCDNVFVTGQCGQVKIGDLGLATLKKASFAKSVIGTPEFMAPEMYSEQYDESIDVYAFGMCLLEMATGEYPYQECTKPFEIYKRVTQGVKPENYNRVDNDDLKELIFRCIRLKTSQRPTVKELVNHSWFMENNGLKLEIHKDEQTKNIIHENETQVKFRLKVIDKSRRKVPWPDNEEIEFFFDCDGDDPEKIVKELKESTDKINDDDLRYLIQSIKDKILVSKYEREDNLENISSNSTTVTNTTTTTTNATTNNITNNSTQIQQDNTIVSTEQVQQNEQQLQLNQNDSNIKLNQSMTTNENQVVLNDSNINNESQIINNNMNINNNNNNNNTNNENSKVKHLQVHFKEEDSIIQVDQQSAIVKQPKNDILLKFCVLDVNESISTSVDSSNNNNNNIVDTIVSYEFQVDESDKIRYKFKLNIDSPQDITNILVSLL